MDQRRNCVTVRLLLGSDVLYGSSTVRSEQHCCPNVVLNEQGLPYSYGRRQLKKLVYESKIRFSTWNVRTLYGKSREVVEVMGKRKINILCLQETKYVGKKAFEFTNRFKLWYTGKVGTRNGAVIIIDNEWKQNVVEVKRIEDRIISLRIIVGRDTINVISVYAPQVEAEDRFKEKFWTDMENLIQSTPTIEKIFIGNDLNEHVGKDVGQYAGAHSGMDFRVRNNEGQAIIDFSFAYNLKIVNTCFKKRNEHLITYKSRIHRSQIDFFLVRNPDRKLYTNCKVIPGDGVTAQHRVLVLDERYCVTKKETRRAVGETHTKAFEEFYKDLGTKVGERKIYKIAKNKERKTKDLDQVKCIKNEEGKVLVTKGDIKDR
ncbi:craniofacial development protein 2-like [Neltuma alba]|uniref:craniofacial development protein 2-like n=1 Tax=Neltuma alba TaxID=207710 RepID=UPI0010A3162A|nr:craniofacial development protein 2-like [Prosopis alba]